MTKSSRGLAAVLLVGPFLGLGAPAASAALRSLTATLSLELAPFPVAVFAGSGMGSSAGAGGAATLPAGLFSGLFQTDVQPPVLGLLDGFAVAAPGSFGAVPTGAISNAPLAWDGTTGTMALNASAYLMMGGIGVAEIPLGVVGIGGTIRFPILPAPGSVIPSVYQLGMVTLMGSLNGEPLTRVATGVDQRTPGGEGTLVLVSPTYVHAGVLGSLPTLATLALHFGPVVPEPGTLLLLGAGVVALAVGRRRAG